MKTYLGITTVRLILDTKPHMARIVLSRNDKSIICLRNNFINDDITVVRYSLENTCYKKYAQYIRGSTYVPVNCLLDRRLRPAVSRDGGSPSER
jgi:hypothetical protein